LRFCCWNVNGLTTERKARLLQRRCYAEVNNDVVGLTETHLSQAGEWSMDPSLAAAYDLFSCTREREARRVEGEEVGDSFWLCVSRLD